MKKILTISASALLILLAMAFSGCSPTRFTPGTKEIEIAIPLSSFNRIYYIANNSTENDLKIALQNGVWSGASTNGLTSVLLCPEAGVMLPAGELPYDNVWKAAAMPLINCSNDIFLDLYTIPDNSYVISMFTDNSILELPENYTLTDIDGNTEAKRTISIGNERVKSVKLGAPNGDILNLDLNVDYKTENGKLFITTNFPIDGYKIKLIIEWVN